MLPSAARINNVKTEENGQNNNKKENGQQKRQPWVKSTLVAWATNHSGMGLGRQIHPLSSGSLALAPGDEPRLTKSRALFFTPRGVPWHHQLSVRTEALSAGSSCPQESREGETAWWACPFFPHTHSLRFLRSLWRDIQPFPGALSSSEPPCS